MVKLAIAIWNNAFLREAVLFVASAVAAQLAFGLSDLLNIVNTSKSWGDLLTGFNGWLGAFSFALVITLIKQTIAFAIQKLAGGD